MNKIKKNLMELAIRQQLEGSKIYVYEDDIEVLKTVSEFIKYDSMTHTFILEFDNGDIQELSDKIMFDVEFSDIEYQTQSKKPNKKRAINK